MLDLKYSSSWEKFLVEMKNSFMEYGLISWALLGGAVRDYFLWEKHGTVIKDLDIFYHGELPTAFINKFVTKTVVNEGYPEEGLFNCTHKGQYLGFNVDFIKIHPEYTYTEVISSFPCNASQIGALLYIGSSHVEVIYTTYFENFYNGAPLTFDTTCPEEYKEKIKKKFHANMPIIETSTFMSDSTDSFWDDTNTFTTNNTVTISYAFSEPLKPIVKKGHSLKKYKVINSEKELYRELGW